MAVTREHQAALRDLPDVPSHMPRAYYLAGLSVECLFRAYSELLGAPHEAHHDLFRHAANGQFFSLMPVSRRDDLETDLNEVWKRWLNNHRYKPLAKLRRFLTAADLHKIDGRRTVKGDVVEYNWLIMSESTLGLLSSGIEQWKFSENKFNKS